MENTNELGLKKYIKLENGRVLETAEVQHMIEVDDITGCKYITEYYETFDDDVKIIATSDYLYKFNMLRNEFELDVAVKKPNGKYEFLVGFNPDNELYITKHWIPCLLGADEEILLGSWYEGGMRFVAKWDHEKKDWEVLDY